MTHPPDLPRASANKASSLAEAAGVALLLGALCVVLQQLVGAYVNDYGTDEAAHFVTAILLHDFVLQGGFMNPVEFAKNFYVHYPKVGLGHWPPALYVLLGGWMAVFGVSRASALAFVACLAALMGTVLYLVGRRLLGRAAGWFAAGLWCVSTLTQEATARVMPEHLVNLLMLLAALQFARYLRTERPRDSLAFGVLATGALLTRGSAWALGLLPLLALVLTWRHELLRRWSLWLGALPVLLVAVPWYAATWKAADGAWLGSGPGLPFWLKALRMFAGQLFATLGPALLATAALGIWIQVVRPWTARRVDPLWAALLALAIATLVLHCLIPVGLEARYMLTLIPSLLLFSAAGLQAVGAFLAARTGQHTRQGLMAVLVGAVLAGTFLVQRAGLPHGVQASGFATTAARLHEAGPQQVMLVASDPRGEGSIIAHIAAAEQRPGSLVLRASKILVKEDWFGRNSQDLYDTPQKLSGLLDQLAVGQIVVDTTTPPGELRPYHQRLQEFLGQADSGWKMLDEQQVVRAGRPQQGRAYVYVRSTPLPQPVDRSNLRQARQLMGL